MMFSLHFVVVIFALAILSWIRCETLAFVLRTEHSQRSQAQSLAQVVPGGSKIDLSPIDHETEERVRKRERRRGFGMPWGTGATSDRIHFSIAQVDVNMTDSTVMDIEGRPKPGQRKKSQWFVTFGNLTGLLDTSATLPSKRPTNTRIAPRVAAEAAFQVHVPLLEDKGTKDASGAKVNQLSSLLKIPIASARKMIRRVPALAGMDITATLSGRCIDMSVLLRCTPTQVNQSTNF